LAVLSELPPKKRKEVYISVDSDSIKEMDEFKQKNKLKQSLSRLLIKKDRLFNLLKLIENSTIMRLYEMTGVAKIPSVRKYIKNEVKAGNKFLVFAHHKNGKQ
jgi:hypothetical protein